MMTRDTNLLEFIIRCDTEELCTAIGESICEQLVGNKDFIDNNILINYTETSKDVIVCVAVGTPFSLNVESDGNNVKITMGGK